MRCARSSTAPWRRYQFTNPGDRTLVGALNPDGSVAQGMPIVFTAPANAQTITTNRIDLIPGADLTGQKLTLRMPIPPGASDITATYDMPGSPSGFIFVRTLDYAATKLQVLVSDSRQAMNSQTLHNDGPIQAPQGATPFRQFSADNAQAGQTYRHADRPEPRDAIHRDDHTGDQEYVAAHPRPRHGALPPRPRADLPRADLLRSPRAATRARNGRRHAGYGGTRMPRRQPIPMMRSPRRWRRAAAPVPYDGRAGDRTITTWMTRSGRLRRRTNQRAIEPSTERS